MIPLGIVQLSERLKEHPDLVDDFFGREWVREFCGHDVAERMAKRVLKPEEICQLRTLLRHCYAQYFETIDPGLPSLTSTIFGGPQPLPLLERFILPDVLEVRQITQMQQASSGGIPHQALSPTSPPQSPVKSTDPVASGRQSTRMLTTPTEIRRPAFDWLIDGELFVVIGDPGIGKSSLLRYVLLDLLSTEPKHETLAIKWGNRLPVWVPFAMWTRMVAESESRCSLADVLQTWLHKVCAPPDLAALVQQALVDSRLLLFVDGLDEWSNETSARSTVALLEQYVGENKIPAIASSRPLGFERLGGLSGKWQRAKLAGLMASQQQEFASRWFLHQACVSDPSNRDSVDSSTQAIAIGKAKELIREIQRDGRLARLAEIPLLLSGLIALSTQQMRLPRSRFKAYEELTRLLLLEQPQRRERAGHARASFIDFNHETRERALARLAYAIHQEPGSDAIDKAKARETLREFFTSFLHKQDSEAWEKADQLLALGADSLGILVEKSPQEVGFPHRAFQEFCSTPSIQSSLY
ncbi:MAG: NACHT domain-containing protein [Nitrospirae bacterium]|nr:NACHT domain-containing protein [Nitrospirota bacterium]MDA1303142.1 NACHT domain-containing protein [Nitrospirota bacterium]